MQNTLLNAIGIADPNGVAVVGSGNAFDPSITTQVNPASANQLTGSGGSLSPDGTVSLPPNGSSLRSTAGIWTWGPATTPANPVGCGGCYQLYLNGSYAPGDALNMEVAHGGQLYAYNNAGWWLWNGRNWTSSAP